MTDWTSIALAAMALVGSLGGYRFAARNEEVRDRRAAIREAAGRRETLAERLEEDRHTFQRDTLLELQDELMRLVRNTAQISLQDQRTIKEHGQVTLIGGNLAEEGRQITVSVQRLRARVLDNELRAAIGRFVSQCSAAGIAAARLSKGVIPEAEREAATERIGAEMDRVGSVYDALTDMPGTHLRREIDRRFLIAPDDATG